MACVGVEIKEEEKNERKTYLKEEETGNTTAHSSPKKNHGQRKLETGERGVSQKKQKYLDKVKEMNGEVLKIKKPKRTENQRETQ